MEEIWKDIQGYEGLYMVSNLGNIKSLNYRRTGKEEYLTFLTNSTEHIQVILFKNGNKKPFQVHILVAQAFIPNPENKSEVHHIDGNPANNSVDNLMWVTHKEHRIIHQSKPVCQYTLDGKFIKEWDSATDIKNTLGFDNSLISKCCRKKRPQVYGFIWKFKEPHIN